MANPENIEAYTFDKIAPSKQREIASKGGKARAEKMKKKKTLAEIADMIGELRIISPKKIKMLRDAGIADEDLTNDVGMIYRLNLKAQIGDAKAIELLAKLRGQMKEQISAEVAEVKPLVDLTGRKKNGN